MKISEGLEKMKGARLFNQMPKISFKFWYERFNLYRRPTAQLIRLRLNDFITPTPCYFN